MIWWNKSTQRYTDIGIKLGSRNVFQWMKSIKFEHLSWDFSTNLQILTLWNISLRLRAAKVRSGFCCFSQHAFDVGLLFRSWIGELWGNGGMFCGDTISHEENAVEWRTWIRMNRSRTQRLLLCSELLQAGVKVKDNRTKHGFFCFQPSSFHAQTVMTFLSLSMMQDAREGHFCVCPFN